MLTYANTSTIYISQKNGKPYYSGFKPTIDGNGNGPLATIEDAIFKLCQLRISGNAQPLTVCFVDEEFYLPTPINLDKEFILRRYYDNEVLCDVWFDSMPGKRTKLIGGKKIEGFKEDTFNGHKCLSAYIPEVKEKGLKFTDLYVNGKRASLTRFPKEGSFRCVDTEYNEGELFTPSKWFIAHKEDLNEVSNIEDAIVSYYHYWIDEHSPIESYDKETGKLTMEYLSRFLISNKYDQEHFPANLEYYLENVPNAFENPGEWYLETSSGKVYYIPENDSITPENIVAYAPTMDTLVNIIGTENEFAKNIRFRNIDFVCSKGDYASTEAPYTEKESEPGKYGSDCQAVATAYGAINLKFAHNCSFENCNFQNLGIHGVSVDVGCQGISIENCKFYDLGAGAIRIFGGAYGTEEIYHTHHNKIKNCEISYCGKRYAAACGILVNHSYCNEILDNNISQLDYSGISVGWVWGYANSITHDNIIKGNDIHHIGMGNLSDMGGIYLLGRQRGTIVANNKIHDVLCKHYGGWGIYTDEGSSYITIENNVVYNCSSNCYHQHYGSYNVVKNNIFAHGGEALIRCSVPEMHTSLIFERNIFVTDGKPIYAPHDSYKNGQMSGVGSHSNIIFDTTKTEPVMFLVDDKEFTLKDAKALGSEDDSIVADPMLNNDYTLKDNSPAFEIGFRK